jgi:hypothetical protein
MSFTDVVVIAGDGFQRLGALAPGADVTVGFEPRATTFNGPPALYTIYPNYTFGPPPSQPTAAQRDGETKTEILSLVQSGAGLGFKLGGSGAAIVPMVVGWTDQSFQDVTINGAHPRAHNLSAVAMPLPIEEIGAGSLPTGVVSGRIIDLEGDTQPGPAGALVVQNGSVTIQFSPGLAAGLHLSNPTLSGTNMFFKGPPGMPGAPGSAAPTRGEAWDWSRSAWVDIAYKDAATTPLPPEVINPAGGEVRLRITVGSNSILASGISLSGSVE